MEKNDYINSLKTSMIMEQSRHIFVYGYNTDRRYNFLKEIEKDYPICVNTDKPMAIYLDDFGVLELSSHNNDLDNNKVNIICSEYFAFNVAYEILNKTIDNNIDISAINEKIGHLLNIINYGRNKNHRTINDFYDLLSVFRESRDFYLKYYIDYVCNLKEYNPMNDIAVPFLQLDMFVSKYKEALNNNSYFAIIFDNKRELELPFIKAINSIIGRRINKDISVKVVTEPDFWGTYLDLNGVLIECIHDYGEVALDNSQEEHIKKLKNNYYNRFK